MKRARFDHVLPICLSLRIIKLLITLEKQEHKVSIG